MTNSPSRTVPAFDDEQPTQPIPYESLREVAAAWRVQLEGDMYRRNTDAIDQTFEAARKAVGR